jgi:hypothetical protein
VSANYGEFSSYPFFAICSEGISFFKFLTLLKMDFVHRILRRMAIDKITIVQPSAKLKTNRNTMPPMTATTAIETDIKIVFLKPFPNAIALIFGITIK